MTTESKSFERKPIKLSDIHIDHDANARKTFDPNKLARLTASIKERGLLNPIIVNTAEGAKHGKPYVLIAGERRILAVKELERDEIDATILHTTDVDAAITGMVDNLGRENLTTYETAMGFVHLRDSYKMDAAEIAKRIKSTVDDDKDAGKGFSKSTVNNYMRIIDALHPDLVEGWKKGAEKATVYNFLTHILPKGDHAAQWEAWLILTGQASGDSGDSGDDDDGDDGDDGEEKTKPRRKPSEDAIKLAIAEVRRCSQPEAWKTGALAALQWCVGARARLAGLRESLPEEEGAAKGKKGAKAKPAQ